MLAAGTITAPALLEIYLDRIARLDPQLRSYRVVLADTARQEAAGRAAPPRRRRTAAAAWASRSRSKTTSTSPAKSQPCGSSAVSTPATQDAEVVSRLRAAGAVIIGKTNVPELMIFPFTESLTFGATRNPWNTALTPGGSSGGSGAAVAAGLAPLALGSDGGGSIRIPSGWCGLYGVKPQRDRVPLAPHDDAWCGLSVNGPIARSVEDAALFLDVTTTMPGPDGGFVAAAAKDPGRLRIALSTKVPPPLIAKVGKEQRAAVDEAGALLRDLGHDVVVRDPDYPPAAVYANFLPRYFRGIYNDVR